MKMIAVSAWPPRKHRLHVGVAMKPPSGSTSSLTYGGELGLLDLASGGGEAQDAVVGARSAGTQHALAHAAFLGVDALLNWRSPPRAKKDEAHV